VTIADDYIAGDHIAGGKTGNDLADVVNSWSGGL